MIVTELYNGQGFGNQLWSYVVTRCLALERGFDFGIMSPHKFKGHSFMVLDFGQEVVGGSGPEGGPPTALPEGINHYYVERDTWYPKFKCDIRDFDPGLLTIPDHTKIEGYFQSERYILPYRDQIKTWLKVKEAYDCYDFSADNICVLNIRGGEYKAHPRLIVPKQYWESAIKHMLAINSNMQFVIITDDVPYARELLPDYPAYHFDIGKDYAIVKNAHYLILANSSFSFFPTWLSETVKYVIAPKYWASHNISDGFWSCAFNLYQNWMWQDREGTLFTYAQCVQEYAAYKIRQELDKLGPKPPIKPLSYFGRLRKRFKEKLISCLRKCYRKVFNLPKA